MTITGDPRPRSRRALRAQRACTGCLNFIYKVWRLHRVYRNCFWKTLKKIENPPELGTKTIWCVHTGPLIINIVLWLTKCWQGGKSGNLSSNISSNASQSIKTKVSICYQHYFLITMRLRQGLKSPIHSSAWCWKKIIMALWLHIPKYCSKRPKNNVNAVQWIWKLEFQPQFPPTIWRKCLIF